MVEDGYYGDVKRSIVKIPPALKNRLEKKNNMSYQCLSFLGRIGDICSKASNLRSLMVDKCDPEKNGSITSDVSNGK
jgi:hypothetical protein